MKYRVIAGSLVAVAVAAFFMGCAKVPQAEIDSAKAAVASAKSAEADKYAIVEFSAAQDSLKAGLDEVEKQQAASAIGRNFDKAKASLTAAVTIAGSAKTHAATGKVSAKSEADTLAVQAAAASIEVKTLLDKAPKSKDPQAKASMEAIQNDFKNINASIDEAKQALSDGNYADARIKLSFVMTKLDSMKAELTKEAASVADKKSDKKEKTHKK
jgi:hypothetical protein